MLVFGLAGRLIAIRVLECGVERGELPVEDALRILTEVAEDEGLAAEEIRALGDRLLIDVRDFARELHPPRLRQTELVGAH